MSFYDFICHNCKTIWEEERPMSGEISTSICKSCSGVCNRYYGDTQIHVIDNFIPGIEPIEGHSTSELKQILKNSTYAEEFPDAKFWGDVTMGKVVKKGNVYKRLVD